MYECTECGAGLIFNPKTQMLECYYCGKKYKTEEKEKLKLKIAEESSRKKENEELEDINENMYEAIVYRCTQCGAELLTNEETIATFCSYCGSSAVLEKRNTRKRKPTYVIPFSKTKEECENAYRKFLENAFFAPKNMLDNQQIEKIRGIYIPYWIYSFEKNGLQEDKARIYAGRCGDYKYYGNYILTSNINVRCGGITHDASANLSDKLSEAIAPFDMSDKKEFSPTYLTGFYADSEDVENEIYEKECLRFANESARRKIISKINQDSVYKEYGIFPKVTLEKKEAELALFPVYFLATRNKEGNRISYAIVNGQTGKVAAEVPIDLKKYIITSLILAIPIFILLNLRCTITPDKTLGIAMFFSIISLYISDMHVYEIYSRENKLDDKGYKKKRIKKQKIKFKDKIKKMYRPILAIIIEILIIILNPVLDFFYYFGSAIAIVMTIWSFWKIITEINLLTTRKLPHLEARGGDEDA